VSGRTRGVALPRAVDALLRELVNALGKTAMYPPGHRFISESAAGLLDRLRDGMADRDALSIGILPRGLLLDGVAIEPLPGVLRDFAARMHRRNVGTLIGSAPFATMRSEDRSSRCRLASSILLRHCSNAKFGAADRVARNR